MGRRHKIEIAGLNIRTHPHNEESYRNLMWSLYNLKSITKIRGDRYGLITSIDRRSEDSMWVSGVLTTFLEIDLDGEWFDTVTMAEASDNEREKIVIPGNLRPNAVSYRFVFDVQHHTLIFEHYLGGDRFTHQSAAAFFGNLVKKSAIRRQYGDVKVTVINSRGSVDKLFSIPRITEINIYIEKPNSDVWGGIEHALEDQLNDKNARSMNVTYKAERGSSIRKDRDLEVLVQASVRNGQSVAKGYGADGHVVVSTSEYPKVVQEQFEEDVSADTVFSRLSRLFGRYN